ncbi:NADH dehydrogenase subunit 2 (mitochondrion) [Amblyomma americanum]|uniref:NADH-ubiquinone oxidoreductase chain 2 n=2 Tax=Amblyomma americanum TaxID=6943 RepID=A0A0K0PRF2_AMBAM|nr:NADH dehydrogenase subunit 2 [Amblyomma americanum]AKQ50890.1 NADH dehydrogenase subunit 2 [Amblyomma americanum]
MFFKNMMMWLILLTIFISFSSSSWFIFWLMMEMNLLLFIPILNNKKIINSNLMITYFIIQSFSSSLFFFSSLNFLILESVLFKSIMNVSMMIKLALIPFHFWLTSLSEMINFPSLFMLLTMQKLIPLFVLTNFLMKFMIFFILISSLLGSLLALNSKTFKKILIFSSISHQGWVLSLIFVKSNFWISYMLIYSILIYKISFLLKKMNFNYIMDFFNLNKNYSNKISLIFMMMSLGGMPPFLGFLIKLISIFFLIQNSSVTVTILIISSMINIFFYMRILTPTLFLNYLNTKNLFKNKTMNKNFIFNLNMILCIFILNLMII